MLSQVGDQPDKITIQPVGVPIEESKKKHTVHELLAAIEEKDTEQALLIIKSRTVPDLNAKDTNEMTALHKALKEGLHDVAKALI